jgi:hypothetical protein
MDSSSLKEYEKIISYCIEDHTAIGINSHAILDLRTIWLRFVGFIFGSYVNMRLHCQPFHS